jgi:hypothetical protein
MIPGQEVPDQGYCYLSWTIRFSQAEGNHTPQTAKRIPLGRVRCSIPKLDHL